MTKERDKKLGRDRQLLEAAQLGQFNQLETILCQFQQLKTKKRSNPLASLRKCIGPSNIRDPVTGFTCLHYAALNGHSQCVQLILNHGARLNAVDYKGSSALHLAAWSGRLQVIKVLLAHSASSSSAVPNLRTVASGSHRSSSSPSSSLSQADGQTKSLTMLSARQQQQQVSKQQPQQRGTNDEDNNNSKHDEIDLDLRNNDGQTALLLAAQFGYTEVVGELIRHSANVNLRNNRLESPLDLACLNGHASTVRLLLNASQQLVLDLHRSHSTMPTSTLDHSIARDQSASIGAGETNSSQRQPRTGWASLLRGGGGGSGDHSGRAAGGKDCDKPTRRASLAPTKTPDLGAIKYHQLGSLDLSSGSERLLDHSPLHYAVRRCHVEIVSLLLEHYDANLFQLTSLGGVLHEIVLNNCDSMTAMSSDGSNATNYTNGDMLRLFLAHLSRISAGNIGETRARWNQLLGARNSRQQTVFDVINELNTQSSQDIKHNIFKLNEQIENSLKVHQQTLYQAQENNFDLGTVEQQPMMEQACREQLFSNARQINSFLTLRRPPNQRQHQPKFASKIPADYSNEKNGQHNNGFIGTQTIDRRVTSSTRNKNHAPLSNWGQQPIAPDSLANQNVLTRSVSNLINTNRPSGQSDLLAHQAQPYGSVDLDWCKLMAQKASGYESSKMHQEQLANVQQLVQRAANGLDGNYQASSALTSSGAQTRKKRSKSRDLGSLLMEANWNKQDTNNNNCELAQTTIVDGGEQVYDNQQMSIGHQQSATNHLVRSQTDCSHLLGRLFGGDGTEADMRLIERRFLPTDTLLRYNQPYQLQHQPRSSDNSSTLLATSHHHQYDHHHQDTRRLMPTAIAQQHSATLDRRAINRHYHVYDHEFYPPRLVANQAMLIKPKNHHNFTPAKINSGATSIADRQRQAAIAIVPPFVRSEANHQADQTPGMSDSNGRLSLNLDQRANSLVDQPGVYVANIDERQLSEQMNRFVKVGSRKSMPLPSVVGGGGNVHHAQRTRPIEADDNEQQQQQSLHGSQSFESHFGLESHQLHQQGLLFESTRQALMRDFDKMIGNELLHRNNKTSGDLSQVTTPMPHSLSSSSQSSSILTGVSLDMDTQGEHLIVSGTRVTMPPPQPASSSANANQATAGENCNRLAQHGQEVSQAGERHQRRRALNSNDDKPNTDNQSLLSHSSASSSSSSASHCAPAHRKPPQKPPRPSLKSQQIYKSLQLQDTTKTNPSAGAGDANRQPKSNLNIYDQPSLSLSQSSKLRDGSLASLDSASSPSAAAGIVPPPVPPLPTPKINHHHQSHNSITEPPNERPPPPPIQQTLVSPILTGPLNVITSDFKRTNYGAHAIKSSASSSNSPSSLSSASSSFRQNQPTNGSISSNHAQVLTSSSGFNARPTVPLPVDIDSGFCTSNSPASHDSESGGAGSDSNETSFYNKRSKPTSRSSGHTQSPPSPRTAQASIEEALIPLDEPIVTQEMANQTDMLGSVEAKDSLYERLKVCQIASEDDDSLELGSQVDMVFGWLGGATKENKEDSASLKCDYKNDKTNYENCIELQEALGTSAGERHEESVSGSLNPVQEQQIDESVGLKISPSTSMDITLGSNDLIEHDQTVPVAQCDDDCETPSRRRNVIGSSLGSDEAPCKTQASNSSNDQSPKQCKEITLKVVVDESNKLNNGDEVFYINPIELKKISCPTECNKSEAQTLTDEELCASVDKDSGYIRFTLRRRRCLNKSINQLQQAEDVTPNGAPSQDSDKASAIACFGSVEPEPNEVQTDSVDKESPVCQEVMPQPQTASMKTVSGDVINGTVTSRKPSADSLQADLSQVSSSSTSSEISIKSIVSLKRQQLAPEKKADERSQVLPPVGRETNPISEKSDATCVGPAGSDNNGEKVMLTKAAISKRAQCSLVGEAARRIENAAAAAASDTASIITSAGPTKQPIAAARKTLERRDSKALEDKVGVKPASVALPARRSICWPPLKSGGSESPAEEETSDPDSTVPKIGRVTANRLSFQKLIEENNKSNSFVSATSRPKPPPPAKPAGLMAAAQRFGNKIN
uniref:Ankyrin repeat and SAM domain-containing protein 1A n=1 Tax=Aceria tosichella TaxID=561515 RepID=A0A6G1SKA8_9ACAR